MTLDIIGHAALSQDFKTLTDPENELLKSFKALSETDNKRMQVFALNFVLPFWFVQNLPFEFIKQNKYHCSVLRRRCEDILAEKKSALKKSSGLSGETDMLRDVIASNAFSDTVVVDQMLTFLAAGVSIEPFRRHHTNVT